MQLELYCPSCRCQFMAGPRSAVAAVLKGLEEAGPWSALGDGETVEDLFHNALASVEETDCPDCGSAATLNEGTLGELTHSLLATW
jgi:hypothetical protein